MWGVQRGSDPITTFNIMKWRPPSYKKNQFFRKNLSVIYLKYTQHMRNPFTTTLPEPKYYIIFESPDAVNLRSNIVIYKLRIISFLQNILHANQYNDYLVVCIVPTYKSKYYFIRSMLKSEKRCNLGRPHCLSPRLKKKS